MLILLSLAVIGFVFLFSCGILSGSFDLMSGVWGSWSTALLVVIIDVSIIVVGNRPSRMLNYELSEEGFKINDYLTDFSKFKSFSVSHDGEFWSLILIPAQRFGLEVSSYIPEDKGEEIVDFLAKVLPMENPRSELMNKLIRKLKL
jgi:hypothetical protein